MVDINALLGSDVQNCETSNNAEIQNKKGKRPSKKFTIEIPSDTEDFEPQKNLKRKLSETDSDFEGNDSKSNSTQRRGSKRISSSSSKKKTDYDSPTNNVRKKYSKTAPSSTPQQIHNRLREKHGDPKSA